MKKGGDYKLGKNERSSPKLARKASKALRDPHSSKREKSLAGSVLTQARDKKK